MWQPEVVAYAQLLTTLCLALVDMHCLVAFEGYIILISEL